jgi:hypothetical protein
MPEVVKRKGCGESARGRKEPSIGLMADNRGRELISYEVNLMRPLYHIAKCLMVDVLSGEVFPGISNRATSLLISDCP